jgi:hypothetical protein
MTGVLPIAQSTDAATCGDEGVELTDMPPIVARLASEQC